MTSPLAPVIDPAAPSERRFEALLRVFVATLAVSAAGLAAFKLARQIPFLDFHVLWAAARLTPDQAYQSSFPYPPSALLLLAPMGRLAFGFAGAAWTGVTLAAFAWVCGRLLPADRRLLGVALIVLTPGAAWAAVSGQASFLIGALVVAGVASLRRRPWLAGLLLGVAMAIKPSDLVLAPVALIAGRHWRALLGAGLGGLAMVAASAALFGVEAWRAWAAGLTGFTDHVIESRRYFTAIITPSGLALQLGLSGWVSAAWRIGFAIVGLATVTAVFARTERLAPRLTALIGAGLLASPYAMNYAATLLAPGAVVALFAAAGMRARLIAVAAFVAVVLAGLPNVGAPALLAFLLLSLGSLAIRPTVDAARPA